MVKISLKTSLKSKQEKEPIIYIGAGIFDVDKIVYQENNVTMILRKLEDHISLVRRCNDYEISFCFDKTKKTEGKYQLLSLGKEMDFQITTSVLEWTNQRIQVIYELELENENLGQFEYNVTYEVKK